MGRPGSRSRGPAHARRLRAAARDAAARGQRARAEILERHGVDVSAAAIARRLESIRRDRRARIAVPATPAEIRGCRRRTAAAARARGASAPEVSTEPEAMPDAPEPTSALETALAHLDPLATPRISVEGRRFPRTRTAVQARTVPADAAVLVPAPPSARRAGRRAVAPHARAARRSARPAPRPTGGSRSSAAKSRRRRASRRIEIESCRDPVRPRRLRRPQRAIGCAVHDHALRTSREVQAVNVRLRVWPSELAARERYGRWPRPNAWRALARSMARPLLTGAVEQLTAGLADAAHRRHIPAGRRNRAARGADGARLDVETCGPRRRRSRRRWARASRRCRRPTRRRRVRIAGWRPTPGGRVATLVAETAS